MNTKQRLILASNERLKLALMVARIHRAPETICEVRDAINWRQSMRTRSLSGAESKAFADHYASQLRNYGRVEVPYRIN